MNNNSMPLFRVIVPKFPRVNIYSYVRSTTDLGSAMLATVASKLPDWRVEIIQENNYWGPADRDGLPDHRALQRERPATVVGFCCGLTSSVERAWTLAELYKSQGIVTLAGGWHAHYCPEETLRHNIDLVVHGDGEPVIGEILWNVSKNCPLQYGVPGCSYLLGDTVCHHNRQTQSILQIPDMAKGLVDLRNEVENLDALPTPDFGLLKYAHKIRYFPIGRTRGCGYNCEFCGVRGGVHFASGRHLFEDVDRLVKTQGARRFFIVDDRFEQDLPGAMEFLRLVKEKYGRRLIFAVQVRLECAENAEFVQAMADAGVRILCIGYESPDNGDLRAMRKGITSAKMLEWTEILGRHFWIHAMYIFGYPPASAGAAPANVLGLKKRYKDFIHRALQVCPYGFTLQLLKPIPGVGTDLRRRLEAGKRVFSREVLPWQHYDGNRACFMPENMTLQELQDTPAKIMDWYYSQFTLRSVLRRAISFPPDYFAYGWNGYRRRLHRELVGYAGSHLVRRWHEEEDSQNLTAALQKYWETKIS